MACPTCMDQASGWVSLPRSENRPKLKGVCLGSHFVVVGARCMPEMARRAGEQARRRRGEEARRRAWSMAILHGARCKVQQLHVLGRGTISPGPALHVHKQERAGGAPSPPQTSPHRPTHERTSRRLGSREWLVDKKGGGGDGKQLRHSSQH